MYTESIKRGVSEAFANGTLHLRAKYQRRKLQYMNNDIYCIFISSCLHRTSMTIKDFIIQLMHKYIIRRYN